MRYPSAMKKTSAVILLLHIFSISDAERRGKIFMGYRGRRMLASPKDDESLNTTLPGKPQGADKPTTTERSGQATAVAEDDSLGNLSSDGQSGIEQQLFEVGVSHHQDKPGGRPFRILTSLLDKAAGFVNYLSHPNVALTPFVLLGKLKRKFYQHLRDKLNSVGAYHHQHEDYPFAYKFGNA